MYRGNIQQIRLSKIFDMFLSTFLLLSLSLFILLTISGILEITIKSLLGYDIFSYITFKNNNIPLSINLESSFFGPFREELAKIIPLLNKS